MAGSRATTEDPDSMTATSAQATPKTSLAMVTMATHLQPWDRPGWGAALTVRRPELPGSPTSRGDAALSKPCPRGRSEPEGAQDRRHPPSRPGAMRDGVLL